MSRLLFRLAVSGLMFLIGVAAFSLRHALRHRQSGPSENAAAQVSTPNAIPTLEDKPGASQRIDPYDIMVMGRYTNFEYAYSVLVPEGMMGATSAPPSPQHGFGIDLMNPTTTSWTNEKGFPKAYLYVDGSYNGLELASLDAAVQWHLKFLNEENDHVRLQSKRPTRLGGLRAVRFVASYVEGGESMISDTITAFRTEHDEDIVYTISLRTPASRHSQDKALVTEMQKSWLADPLPDVYPLPPVYEERK